MHWCQDETLAVINMLSSVDVFWTMLRAGVERLLARLLRRHRPVWPSPCECHEHAHVAEADSAADGSR